MISIVIPTYNEAKLLPTLLVSIAQQNYKDYEIIVADNNSTDATKKIAENFQAKIVSGGLPGAARNRGAENISPHSDIILFLDADVVLSNPNFLLSLAREFRAKDLAVATCDLQPLSNKYFDRFFHQLYNYFVRITASTIPHAVGACIIVKPEVHQAINGFDEEIKLAEDSDYAFRAAKIGKFGVLNTCGKVSVSVRRLDRDGRWNIFCKYMLAGLHLRFLGKIKSDIFNYKFAHYK